MYRGQTRRGEFQSTFSSMLEGKVFLCPKFR
jgi:hypothetical protein